jgi:hypothetical protein
MYMHSTMHIYTIYIHSDEIKSRDVICDIQSTSLFLGVKGTLPVIDAVLFGQVLAEESHWQVCMCECVGMYVHICVFATCNCPCFHKAIYLCTNAHASFTKPCMHAQVRPKSGRRKHRQYVGRHAYYVGMHVDMWLLVYMYMCICAFAIFKKRERACSLF